MDDGCAWDGLCVGAESGGLGGEDVAVFVGASWGVVSGGKGRGEEGMEELKEMEMVK